ncbi:MAG: hypothetical protein M0P97_01795 [Candidatus Moranbacteria bacterium]|jgi:hypothetical protein|nr:hypothetical protein [Candidatus Moranbacteria bacterium]
MKNFLKYFTILFFVVALLSGCANKIEVFTGTEIPVENSVMEFKIDQPPVMTLGIPMADYRSAQEFVMPFSRELENEYRLFRVSWIVVGIDSSGNLYPGVGILETDKRNSAGNFWCIGKVFAPQREGINIFILSTRAKYAYGIEDKGILIDRNLLGNKEYLASIFSKGIPLSSLFETDRFGIVTATWESKRTPFGFLTTSREDEVIDSIAVINTGYSPDERRMRDRRNVIAPNPIGMTIGWSIDGYQEIQEQRGVFKTSGWDFDSPVSEEEKNLLRQTLNSFRAVARVIDYGGSL